MDEHRAAVAHARAPAHEVVARRAEAVRAVDVEQVDRRPRAAPATRASARGGRARARRGARGWRGRARVSSSPSSGCAAISCGPRSEPRCGSIATTSTPAAAARASTIVERPRNEPISTIRPPAGTAPRAAVEPRGLGLGQPALDVARENASRRRRVRLHAARASRAPARRWPPGTAGRARSPRTTGCSGCPALSRNGSAIATTPSTHRKRASPSASMYCTVR